MGESTAKSGMDDAFKDFQLPSDPDKLGQMYGDVASNLYEDLGISGALDQSNTLTQESGVADAAAVFENRIKGEEYGKVPLADLDTEIDRLSEQRWGVLPAVLGRSDITDYGAKLKIAARAEQILDGEIDRLTSSRKSLVDAADARAKDKVEMLKAEASILDKRATAAQNDLRSRIDLFKEGKSTFDDVVQAALELKKLNDEKAKSGAGGNPFLGIGDNEFTQEEVLLFGAYEKMGDEGLANSVKTQDIAKFKVRYGKWRIAGRPGSKVTVDEPKKSGWQWDPKAPKTMDVSELFADPAAAKKNLGFWGGLPMPGEQPAAPASVPTGDIGVIDESGEYTPPN